MLSRQELSFFPYSHPQHCIPIQPAECTSNQCTHRPFGHHAAWLCGHHRRISFVSLNSNWDELGPPTDIKEQKEKFQINLLVRAHYLGISSFQPRYLSGQTQMNIVNFWHIDQPWPLLCPFISIQTLDPGVMCCDAFRNNNTTKNKEIFKHAGLSNVILHKARWYSFIRCHIPIEGSWGRG